MIHCFKIGGRNLILDVNSGALHSVDDAAFGVLKNMGEGRGEMGDSPATVREEIQSLIDAGQLFAPDRAAEAR
ncbi:MAG: hypothetical protein FWF80_06475, partial [Defluviitaleaceae bacterium]|nr:hypothetical protein [Defluviitaleaceae bacterium]